ncbi:3-oxoacyl-[acyl-carrier-protein] reductase [Salix suchowensis]|nr:3-oxoacyl-[acyl-carrier-protein] reductase [Salix suchowensis]
MNDRGYWNSSLSFTLSLGYPLECAFLSGEYQGVHLLLLVATIEKASAEATQKVESLIVVVTRASGGIGKVIALSLGKTGLG